MKPAAFEYVAPTALLDVLELLQHHGEDAKLLAGGQSLVPMLNFRLCSYGMLIDLNKVEQLSYIVGEGDELCIGAMTRLHEIECSPLVERCAPLLATATSLIAHRPIRHRGTIGGSLCHADPAAEYPAGMLALEASMVVRSRSGERQVAATEFFQGPLATVLTPEEMLIEVRIPAMRPGQGFAFEEVNRRAGDFAIIGLAAAVDGHGGRIENARLAVCGLASGPVRLPETEGLLRGTYPTAERLREAGRTASQTVAAHDDLHAEADYRRHLIQTLLPRAVTRAVAGSME